MRISKNNLEKINITCVNQNLKKLSRSVGVIYDRKLAKNSINVNQFAILSYIFYYENITLGKLALRLSMDRTTLSKNLKPLLRENYITIISADDKRMKILCLTEYGTNTLENSLDLWAEAQKDIYRKYGKKKIHTLLSILNDLLSMDTEE